MVVDRIERHDVMNAVMLAVVLLLLGFGLISATRSLFSTVDEGLITSSKEPTVETVTDGTDGATDDSTSAESTASSAVIQARPAADVIVRVANGARRRGVAGNGTAVLDAEGYLTLSPKNGPTIDESVVYYVSGFAADAAAVAELLGLEATQIEPMPSDPGVAIEDAHVIAILGADSDI